MTCTQWKRKSSDKWERKSLVYILNILKNLSPRNWQNGNLITFFWSTSDINTFHYITNFLPNFCTMRSATNYRHQKKKSENRGGSLHRKPKLQKVGRPLQKTQRGCKCKENFTSTKKIKKAPRKNTNIKGSSKTKTKSKSKKKRKKRTKSEQKPAKRAQIKSIPATYHFTSVKPFFTKPHKPPPESRKLIINPPSPVFDPPKFEEEKHDVTFIPTQKLPDIQEIHRRVTTSAKEEKVNVDMRVPLLLRAAMNKMVTKKLQRLPIDRRAEKAGCWCDVLWEGNRRLYKNSLFRKHWQNCKRQNHLPFARSILWQTDKMSNESI